MSEAPRLPYVKYSTGANRTICVIYRALRKPDSTVARRAFLDRKCNGNTHNGTTRLFARQRYFASSALFFHIFSRKREKIWSPKAQLQCRCKKQHFRCIRKGVPRLRRGIMPSGHKECLTHSVREKLPRLSARLVPSGGKGVPLSGDGICALAGAKEAAPLRGDKKPRLRRGF